MSRTLLRAGTLLGTTALIALAGAAPAFAHVTAEPGHRPEGRLRRRHVPRARRGRHGGHRRRSPSTCPPTTPSAPCAPRPIAGWTVTPNEVTLNPPLKDDDGNAITKTVGSVTLKANPGNRIGPGQYLDFPLSLGPFPDNVDVIRMPAVADLRQREGRQLGRPAQRRRLRARAPGAVGRR